MVTFHHLSKVFAVGIFFGILHQFSLSPNIDCIIISPIYISWSCKKRQANLKRLIINFVDAQN